LQLIRASIEIRASVGDVLRSWSEFAAPAHPRQVDFEPIAGVESRITVRLERQPTHSAQRELERHLAAFKSFVERRVSAVLREPA
jgi:hypothetical protein